MINKNKTLWPLWRVLRECVCVWGEESACGSHTKSVCQVLCQCCVEDAVCSSGLGTHCIHPLFRVCLCVPVRVVLHLKHGWFTQQMGVCVCLCESVCLFTHLMDYTVKKVGELANTERLDTARMKEYTCWFLGVQADTTGRCNGKKNEWSLEGYLERFLNRSRDYLNHHPAVIKMHVEAPLNQLWYDARRLNFGVREHLV